MQGALLRKIWWHQKRIRTLDIRKVSRCQMNEAQGIILTLEIAASTLGKYQGVLEKYT